jgi:hypothetical protein
MKFVYWKGGRIRGRAVETVVLYEDKAMYSSATPNKYSTVIGKIRVQMLTSVSPRAHSTSTLTRTEDQGGKPGGA